MAWLPVSVSRLGEAHTDAEHVYDQLLVHCREMNNRFLILDPPRGLHGELLVRWVRDFRAREQHTRSYGALYYPWLFEGVETFPPSASMAGVYARVEREKGEYGVVWPPANVPVKGVTHLELELSFSEAGDMAEAAINPLILQAGRGIVVFGARTLSSELAYRFINSRRVISMITEQLRRDNEWAVFETNNPHLWDVLDRDVRYRLEQFWRAGLLDGERAGEQYAVTCNATNNPRYLLDAGQVNVEIRMRPVGTTEQIVIDLRLGG
jgi:phage tail sheath protein FI